MEKTFTQEEANENEKAVFVGAVVMTSGAFGVMAFIYGLGKSVGSKRAKKQQAQYFKGALNALESFGEKTKEDK